MMNKDLTSFADLKRLVDFIVSKYKPDKIILFGSYGSGKEKKSSDIDLLIIKRTDKRFIDRVVELIQLIRNRFGVKYPVEPLVYTPDEFRNAQQINSIFIRTVLSKGVVLYGEK